MLAESINNILPQTSGLIPAEVDAIYAIASVAMSSTEYWAANIDAQADQVGATYGSCLVQYNDATSALSSCLGVNPPSYYVTPTNWKGFTDPWSATFTSNALTQQGIQCYKGGPETVAADIGGAVLGLFGAFVFRRPYIESIVRGSGAGSIFQAAASLALYEFCRRKGGLPQVGNLPQQV